MIIYKIKFSFKGREYNILYFLIVCDIHDFNLINLMKIYLIFFVLNNFTLKVLGCGPNCESYNLNMICEMIHIKLKKRKKRMCH